MTAQEQIKRFEDMRRMDQRAADRRERNANRARIAEGRRLRNAR